MLDGTIVFEDRKEISPDALMNLWTLYRHPSDFPPGTWVARRSEVHSKGMAVMTADIKTAMSREDLIGKIPPGLTFVPRMPNEDPVIIGHYL